MFSPFFENYRAQVIMADCEPVFVPLNPPTFSFDPNVLEDAFRGGAKAIIICNPSNPSGKVFTEEELQRPSPTSASATTFTPSWTRCMSTSSTTAASTST